VASTLQDEVGGLQIKTHAGEWVGVRPRKDAFVINIGDMMQVKLL
jgi:isopenicillin N synthase-like dioxygenase